MCACMLPFQCFDTVGWLGDRKGTRPVKTRFWFVGGDDFTGALHDL